MAKKKQRRLDRRHAATPATLAADRASVAFTVHAYTHDRGAGTGYGQEAVDALGAAPHRVHKTLVAVVDGALTVAVLPVPAMLDLKALATALGGKRAELADPAAAERATGYVRGGISPLGQRKRLPTVVDAGVARYPTVYVSAGRRGLEIELAPADLIRLTQAVVAPIARSR